MAGYVVQALDDYSFLCPELGDVGSTKRIDKAGIFNSYEEAQQTANDEIGRYGVQFVVFKVCD